MQDFYIFFFLSEKLLLFIPISFLMNYIYHLKEAGNFKGRIKGKQIYI